MRNSDGSRNTVQLLKLLASTSFCSALFLNCSKIATKDVPSFGQNSMAVVCDPLTPETVCVLDEENPAGLRGSIYSYPNGKFVDDYFALGTKLPVILQMSHLNVPARSWESGFPGPNGLLKDPNGQPLLEYFALDLEGFFRLPMTMDEGEYQFATNSDDGSILDLGGVEVINNDGYHSPEWKCSVDGVHLTYDLKLSMRLRYFQGPRNTIALQVFMRPWEDRDKPCDINGGWRILPAAALTWK